MKVKIVGFLLKEEDDCTAQGGHWVTIQGTHVCIHQGEDAATAFKRTTGKDLDGEPKDLKAPSDKVVSDEPKMKDIADEIAHSESELQYVRPTSPLYIDHKDYLQTLNALKTKWADLSASEQESIRRILQSKTFDISSKTRMINQRIGR